MLIKHLDDNNYNRPLNCEKCNGVMIFRGLGEYKCEECGFAAYDDYGKVRNYLEENVGANTNQISADTGVSPKSIRQMVKESRFEVTQDSKTFLQCEICRKPVRSGRYCSECENNVNRSIEAQRREERAEKIAKMEGHSGELHKGETGAKRFER